VDDYSEDVGRRRLAAVWCCVRNRSGSSRPFDRGTQRLSQSRDPSRSTLHNTDLRGHSGAAQQRRRAGNESVPGAAAMRRGFATCALEWAHQYVGTVSSISGYACRLASGLRRTRRAGVAHSRPRSHPRASHIRCSRLNRRGRVNVVTPYAYCESPESVKSHSLLIRSRRCVVVELTSVLITKLGAATRASRTTHNCAPHRSVP
jgi:hypothetical protein